MATLGGLLTRAGQMLIAVLLAFAVIELVAIGVQRAGGGDLRARIRSFAPESWTSLPWWDEMFVEGIESRRFEYFPYVGHRRRPGFRGEFINLDADAVRHTANPCADAPDARSIFVFGGSTSFGIGARDAHTVPSELSRLLCERGLPVDVRNFGESGYGSSEGLIRLYLELRADRVPSAAIFYDGINDVMNAYQSGIGGFPPNLTDRKLEWGARRQPIWSAVFEQLASYRLLRDQLRRSGLISNPSVWLPPERHAEVASQVTRVYLNNLELIQALAEDQGFRTLFFWQPLIATKTPLTEEEQRLRQAGSDTERFQLLTYAQVLENASDHPSLQVVDLTRVLDGHDETLFFDSMHLTERGNRVVAEAMADELAPLLGSVGGH